MPSHAIPPGRDGRAHRRLARRRRLLDAWHRLPLMLFVLTCAGVAGAPASAGSAVSMVLSVLRVGLVGGLLATLVFVVALALRSRVNAWLAPASASRPRWQYLLAAFGWLAVASSLVLLSLWIGTGLPSRASAALGIWSGLYALVLIGRAASWGRVRTLLWWTY